MRIKRTGFKPPFWLARQRRLLEGPLKILQGRTLWVRRLVSGNTPASVSRKFILCWNGAANVAGNLIGGNFLVGLYMVLHVNDVLLGILTTLVQFCNIFQILSPLLLDRFKRKKLVLLVTRIIYYGLYILVIGLIPFIPGEDGFRIVILLTVTVLANLINSMSAPGYGVLHIRSIPEDSRADFFSILNLINNICIYAAILLCGYVVDFFRDRGSLLAGISAVRIIALGVAALEIYCHCQIHEFDEPEEEEKHHRLNPLLPLKNKEFTIITVLTGLFSFFFNIPGLYYASYLINEVKTPYSYLGFVNFLAAPIMLFAIPIWNRVIIKISWYKTISVSMLLVSLHYFMLPFVSSSNYAVLYTFALSYYFAMIPGVNIVTGNLPFYRLPEGHRTVFLAFYNGYNSLMATLGFFSGGLFIVLTNGRKIPFIGGPVENKQFIMVIAGVLLACLGLIYHFIARKEKKGEMC
ncbi:hypothetical protein AGMMS49928_10640 [Spirochaetia bacterium]|nr:hypothetical protein AGMMS49928_10640 [Spirochaetia bacterium]